MENGASVQLVTQSELTGYLNYGLNASLYRHDKLIAARGQEYYRNQYAFNTIANISAYALPADFYELISVDINLGGSMIMSGKKYSEYQRNMFKWYPGWYLTLPVYYRLEGSNINFLPTPTGLYAVTLNYVPTFQALVSGTDTFDGVSGWEEYAIWRAVKIHASRSEESDTSTGRRRSRDDRPAHRQSRSAAARGRCREDPRLRSGG